MKIEDGTGRGFVAKVDSESRLLVAATVLPALGHASDEGSAAYFISTYAATAGQEVISIRNAESDRHLHIQSLMVASSVATIWTLFEVTSGTAAGTTLTYINPNLGSGVTLDVTAFGNASVTGSLAGNTLNLISTVADATFHHNFDGSLILTNGDEVALTADATGTVYVTIQAFWEEA